MFDRSGRDLSAKSGRRHADAAVSTGYPSRPVSATTVIASAGLALSVVSLGWQLLTWRLNGPRVEIAVEAALPAFGAELGEDHVLGTIRNVGRAPVEISAWGVSVSGKNLMLINESQIPNPPMPETLAAHHSLKVHVLAPIVRQALIQVAGDTTTPAMLWVELGNGRKAHAEIGRLGAGLFA